MRCAALLALLLLLSSALALPARASELTAFTEAGPEYFDGGGYLLVEPGVGYDGDRLAFEVSAPLRLQAVAPPPELLPCATPTGLPRCQDWDELSDYGQLLRRFDLSLAEGAFRLKAGALSHLTLGHGTVMNGFGNALEPDHHPTGVDARLSVRAVSLEVVVPDVLGPFSPPALRSTSEIARLLAATVTLEPLSLGSTTNDRLHLLATAVLQDRNRQHAGVGVDFAVLRTSTLRLAPYADANAALGVQSAAGVHAGLLADLTVGAMDVSLEGEWVRGWSGYVATPYDAMYPAFERVLGTDPQALRNFQGPRVGNGGRGEVRVRMKGFGAAASLVRRPAIPGLDAAGVASLDGDALSLSAFVATRGLDQRWHRSVVALEGRYRFSDFLYGWVGGGQSFRDANEAVFEQVLTLGLVPVRYLGAGLGGAVAL